MPSLIRLLTVIGIVAGVLFGTLYVLAEYFEPETKEISKPVRNIKVR
ncbi:MAG: histidine kinase [Methyloligellaceae bacterium]